ncbi:serine-rich adhesin for platelets [Nematostella vectensis]|uniref:serine-rich adhesin for platelets n=1 Tax=Nematostella vectensis TaxID=45351 RepID=UPI0020778D69|nr:serine-rich adhesin for platelets [Nematostella vectensis]
MDTITGYRTGVVHLLLLFHVVKAIPVAGPFPPGVGLWRKVIACENQKVYIKCASIYNVIEIGEATFGREAAMVCLPPGRAPEAPCTEQAGQVKARVEDLCTRMNRCEVSATNSILARAGTVVCPKVSKYLQVQYRCVPRESFTDDENSITENSVTESVSSIFKSSSAASASASASVSSSGSILSYGKVLEIPGPAISGGLVTSMTGSSVSGNLGKTNLGGAGAGTSGSSTSGSQITDTTLLPAVVPLTYEPMVISGPVTSSQVVSETYQPSTTSSETTTTTLKEVKPVETPGSTSSSTSQSEVSASIGTGTGNAAKHDSVMLNDEPLNEGQFPQVVTETMPLLREVVGSQNTKKSIVSRASEGDRKEREGVRPGSDFLEERRGDVYLPERSKSKKWINLPDQKTGKDFLERRVLPANFLRKLTRFSYTPEMKTESIIRRETIPFLYRATENNPSERLGYMRNENISPGEGYWDKRENVENMESVGINTDSSSGASGRNDENDDDDDDDTNDNDDELNIKRTGLNERAEAYGRLVDALEGDEDDSLNNDDDLF